MRVIGIPLEEVNPKLVLNEGEMVCNKCDGYGSPSTIKTKGFFKKQIRVFQDAHCSKCWGSGKVDWIENIVGKKQTQFTTDSTSGMTSMYMDGTCVPTTMHHGKIAYDPQRQMILVVNGNQMYEITREEYEQRGMPTRPGSPPSVFHSIPVEKL